MEDIPDIPTDHGTFDGYSSERYYEELMSFMSESSSMRETAKSAVKQSLFSAGGAFAGSFLGGPVGGLIGGVAGSLIGYIKSDDYDGLIIALTKIETERRTKLMKEVFQVLQTAGGSFQRIQENPEAFKHELYRLAELDAVRNGIWNACLHSTRS